VWFACVSQASRELRWLPPWDHRLLWFTAAPENTLVGQVRKGRPPVVMLRVGQRLEALRKTCFHELGHLFNTEFPDAWSPAEDEERARAFADRMIRTR
jgi:hypothetical protein